MEKNDFLRFNDFVCTLYAQENLPALKETLLRRLVQFIPSKYSSIMTVTEVDGQFHLKDPVCYPPEFRDVEQTYLKFEAIDHTNWTMYSRESMILRESALVCEEERLGSPIYKKFYSRYDIYDTLQMSIAYAGMVYAIITLYRTQDQGVFTSDDEFYMQLTGKHMNYLFAKHCGGSYYPEKASDTAALAAQYHLTPRESEILSYIFSGMNNQKILEKTFISSYTLQKHIQNIYRKMQVSNRLELLQYK